MHSRIFELKVDPTTENELYDGALDDWFFSEYGVDYTSDRKDQEYDRDIKWLERCFENFAEVDETEKSIVFTDVAGLMSDAFDKFHEIIEKLQNYTLEEFAGIDKGHSREFGENMGDLMWILNDTWASKSEFFIYHDEYAEPLFSFIRKMTEDDRATKWYFGGILDYHC